MGLITLYQRAHAQLPLTPEERAFLKLLPGILFNALIAGIVAIAPILVSGQENWTNVALVGIGAVLTTLFYTISKYWSAKGDAPVSTILGIVEAAVQKLLGGLGTGGGSGGTPPQTAAPVAPAPGAPAGAPAALFPNTTNQSAPYIVTAPPLLSGTLTPPVVAQPPYGSLS